MATAWVAWRLSDVGVAIAGILLMGACGGSGGGSDDGAVGELVGRLPGEARVLAAIDVAAVRRDLGLPDDQGMDISDDDARTFTAALMAVVPFLAEPRVTPIARWLDTGSITAAASAPLRFAPRRAVVVVRTSQPFDDLAVGLEREGYERDGDLLVIDASTREVGVVAVTAASDDDGVIVLVQSADVARAVAESEGDGPALARVLETVDGPLRLALGTSEDGDSCLESVAAGWEVNPVAGQLAVTVSDPWHSAPDLLFPGDANLLVRVLDLGRPEVDVEGRTVRARYRYEGPAAPFGLMVGDIPASNLYRCP